MPPGARSRASIRYNRQPRHDAALPVPGERRLPKRAPMDRRQFPAGTLGAALLAARPARAFGQREPFFTTEVGR
jgi:hypothetical protein